jgi:hypothetical protein
VRPTIQELELAVKNAKNSTERFAYQAALDKERKSEQKKNKRVLRFKDGTTAKVGDTIYYVDCPWFRRHGHCEITLTGRVIYAISSDELQVSFQKDAYGLRRRYNSTRGWAVSKDAALLEFIATEQDRIDSRLASIEDAKQDILNGQELMQQAQAMRARLQEPGAK